MERREFLAGVATLGAWAAVPGGPLMNALSSGSPSAAPPLTPPAKGPIPVAVAITDGATVIDFAGPWEVFQDVDLPGDAGFELFTVGDSTKPVRGSAGLQLVPDYAFESAPQPRVIVVGAQRGSDALRGWLRKASEKTDLTMSVCTGAFQLAKAGLLSGRPATTHHDFLDKLASQFPDIEVRRGLRFVESSPHIATAGGLSSGIDLALRVVERYFGREVATRTATYMEYQSQGWKLA